MAIILNGDDDHALVVICVTVVGRGVGLPCEAASIEFLQREV